MGDKSNRYGIPVEVLAKLSLNELDRTPVKSMPLIIEPFRKCLDCIRKVGERANCHGGPNKRLVMTQTCDTGRRIDPGEALFGHSPPEERETQSPPCVPTPRLAAIGSTAKHVCQITPEL